MTGPGNGFIISLWFYSNFQANRRVLCKRGLYGQSEFLWRMLFANNELQKATTENACHSKRNHLLLRQWERLGRRILRRVESNTFKTTIYEKTNQKLKALYCCVFQSAGDLACPNLENPRTLTTMTVKLNLFILGSVPRHTKNGFSYPPLQWIMYVSSNSSKPVTT